MSEPPGIGPDLRNGITGTRPKAETKRVLTGTINGLADLPPPDDVTCRRLLALLSPAAEGGSDERAA